MRPGATKDIIAVGGSTGSGAVLRALVADLPENLPASVFISTHIPSNSPGLLTELLAAKAKLPLTQALDGQPIQQGHIYVAAPDRHLLLIGNTIKFGTGPRENMVRPSIDPMFRSAALSFGPRVVGIVLTGMLNDGAAGLHSIKSCGGTTVVQHPLDAEAGQMPLAALETVEVDYVTPAADLGSLIAKIAGSDASGSHTPSENLRLEVEIAAGGRLGSAGLQKIASPSAITCPACHGVLSEIRDSRPLRYRCQIGHAYTADALAAQIDEVDEAIRVAMRVMEERVTLVERMARDARETGRHAVAELYEARGAEYRGAIVIGPAQSVRRAFELLEAAKTIDAAVLDVNLGGELAYPVADLLIERDVPFVFTTGYDASALPARFVSVRCCEKPVDAGAVVEALRVSTGFR